MATPLIEFINVTKRFGNKTVLDQANLQIFEGEVTTIIGLSGAGKSVLLKHIIGLLTPESGEILVRGRRVGEMGREERRSNLAQISYMFQNNALFDSLTVYENVALPLVETSSLSRAEIHKRVVRRVEQMELTEAMDKYPSELSGGMQKRAALARALVTDPHIVLFDEPTSGQDPVRKNGILGMISQYQKRFHFTAILVSHEIPDVYFISNRILALYHGKIVFQGTPEELEHFDHPFQDEVLTSLEELGRELTGLYSRRLFTMHYRAQLRKRLGDEYYSVIVASMTADDEDTPYQLGVALARYFDARGGFTIRNRAQEFIVFLPYATPEESQEMVSDFVEKELRGREFDASATMNVGISMGRPVEEIKAAVERARTQEQTTLHIPRREV